MLTTFAFGRSRADVGRTDPRLLSAGDDNLDIPPCGTDVGNMVRCGYMCHEATLTEVLGQILIPFKDVGRSWTGRTVVILPKGKRM